MTVRMGRFGPFVQIGTKDDVEKPRFAGLRPGQKMDTIQLADAFELFKLPRTLGETAEGETVLTAIGRFGPYVKYGAKYVSLKEDDPYTVTLERALELIQAKVIADANRLIQDFPAENIQVLNGRYGPYVTDKRKNARVPKDRDPKTLTLEECQALLAAAPAKGTPRSLRAQVPPPKRRRRRLAAEQERARRPPREPARGRRPSQRARKAEPQPTRKPRPRPKAKAQGRRRRPAARRRQRGQEGAPSAAERASVARMKYRHSFHAGNFADVHKHVTLLALIAALQRKDKGFLYLETHAGPRACTTSTAPTPTRAPRRALGIGALQGARSAQPADHELPRGARARSRASAARRAAYPGSPVLAALRAARRRIAACAARSRPPNAARWSVRWPLSAHALRMRRRLPGPEVAVAAAGTARAGVDRSALRGAGTAIWRAPSPRSARRCRASPTPSSRCGIRSRTSANSTPGWRAPAEQLAGAGADLRAVAAPARCARRAQRLGSADRQPALSA